MAVVVGGILNLCRQFLCGFGDVCSARSEVCEVKAAFNIKKIT